ncbi:bifunctional glutamate N-acetyltransferase/amino-acid acetyltransferase ArgJ [uncultured Tateyamaria sp.]|uniref:bifunctional glutamate N-acetyltransferase/amino-acid acetyltransferase ArgJ n=1 Tax=Tateyamaria sp. 1078 TaxID=3417464 RepID=UPI002605FAE8|nr:bifunctional glutamate N-acetyltransferase/amino-acid acetyltransferase ArgJ [uncultured Tateyamaria sp.]
MGDPLPRSPLAPAAFPDTPVVNGVRFAGAEAGVKYKGRKDVMLAVCAPGTAIAGVFTRSATRSAPVLDCQAKLGGDSAAGAAILVNSGNANAFTGRNGVDAVNAVVTAVSTATGLPASRVFTASTGVIGEPLPKERIADKLDELAANLSDTAIRDAADAIMTTDTYAKGASATCGVDGQTVTIAGIAKGSGMIAPDMATMLVYIFTDAQIGQPDLQALVSRLNDKTFNCITVDSDTSTSDSLICAATGASGIDVTGNSGFADALHSVMLDLAHQVVRDGEGATKFVEITVTGAASDAEAKTHGLSIANSPLVKTAIAGEDPNWGRVVMAVGKSGAAADRDALSIRFGDVLVADRGWVSPDYREEDSAAHMKGDYIRISVDIGLGDGAATVWTCDLTHGYISINADYRS